jgi:hypothetical protein
MSQEGRAVFWEVIVSVIISTKEKEKVFVHVSCSERFSR